jgi:hypothetical protein
VDIESGSGSVELALPTDTNVTFTLESGSGTVTVFLPLTSAVKIEVMDNGSGTVHVPAGYIAAAGNTADHGTWQSSNFSSAAHTILIRVKDRGSGNLFFKTR